MKCIFCDIISGKIPALVFYETSHAVAFLDAYPVTPGHALVVPREHHERVEDLPADAAAGLFLAVREAAARIKRICDASLIAIHNGRESGQEIPHVHVHVVPRRDNDGAGAIHRLFEASPKPSQEDTESIHRILSA